MPDLKPNRFKLTSQLMIPETEHSNALRGEKPFPLLISNTLIRKPVSAAVEFDGELREDTVKIEEILAAWILSAEFEFVKAAVTEQVPETFFGQGGLLAQVTREVARA